MSVYTPLLEGCRRRAAKKNAAKLFSLNGTKEGGVSGEAALTPLVVGSRALVLGLVAPGCCALMEEPHISLRELKPGAITATFSPRPRDRRTVPWAGALLPPCQTAHLP